MIDLVKYLKQLEDGNYPEALALSYCLGHSNIYPESYVQEAVAKLIEEGALPVPNEA